MRKKLILAMLLMGLLTACNFPFMKADEPKNIFDQPAQTLTALFASYPTQTAGPAAQVTQAPTSQAASTSTSQLTSTPQPTATAADLERSAQHVTAKYLSKKPVLDGDWGDWKQNTIAYPAYYVVYGLKDDSGLEASFILGWDESFLYVGIKVKDDQYAQNSTGEMIFKGDSVELLIDSDLQGDFSTASLNADDFQLGFSPGKGSTNGVRDAYLWYPSDRKGSISDQVDVVSSSTAGIYRMEIRIPWSLLRVTPHTGMRLGFVFSVSDDDDPSNNIQQSMVSNIAGRVFTNPTTWGELVLD